MAGPDSEAQALAAAAAERIQRDGELRRQLTLLPDEVPETVEGGEARGPGRPKGAKGKVSSQVRDWLAHRGYRMPEEVLGQMLGMARGDSDLMQEAIIEAERVLAWAGDGARNIIWDGKRHRELDGAWQATPEARIELFRGLYAMKLRAAEALLPYGAPKASPEGDQARQLVVMVPMAPSHPGQPAPHQARDVTPDRPGEAPWQAAARRRAQDAETVENQELGVSPTSGDAAPSRTGEENAGETDA
ncbi:hypothetical protein [Roseicyclus amphidinii]|uniref:hypothetical protein n=1 Tax=Roseicyclus amphidinii TaxID=3034232 RepID=UPI0024E16875|nr:hypothetical protein [Roseicyclus sp. Amp-Y-6]